MNIHILPRRRSIIIRRFICLRCGIRLLAVRPVHPRCCSRPMHLRPF